MKPGRFASLSLLALGVLAPVSGCSISAFSDNTRGKSVAPNPYADDAGAGVDAAITQGSSGSSSSGGGSDAATWGNPLCRLATPSGDGGLYGCNPDQPATAIDCAMDGGGAAATDGGGYACRVQPSSSTNAGAPTTPATACSPSSGDLMSGHACTMSDECAPSFDCVGAKGACRQYCCAGNSACMDPMTFCDVQFLTQASATPIPVCMPIVPCDLADQLLPTPTACLDPTKTCAVVREDGHTGCVDIGGAGPNQSCERDHCAEGLVCLGAPGQRVCLTLCDTQTGRQCTAPDTCQGGLPLFQDPRVGVCRQ
ncbi:MAG TPA: hypothetical protein VF765_13575 [Polyangiaceae bacterium]